MRLFKAAFDKSPGSFKVNTVIPINQKDGGDGAAHHASLVRGVVLNLDLGMNLLSVTITPRKVREAQETDEHSRNRERFQDGRRRQARRLSSRAVASCLSLKE